MIRLASKGLTDEGFDLECQGCGQVWNVPVETLDNETTLRAAMVCPKCDDGEVQDRTGAMVRLWGKERRF